MDQLFYAHVKAFLLSHQIGDDPERNLTKIKMIADSNPRGWNGKLPTRGIRPDTSYCKVSEATRSRPISPWWWYAKEHEPVPDVVQDIYEALTFDFAVVYGNNRGWIYVSVEPSAETMRLLERQDQLRAFILMSLINKNFPRPQREHKRVRLGNVMGSPDSRRIFTFVAFKEEDPAFGSIPVGLPVLSRLVHPSGKAANWQIRLPGEKRICGSFREIVPER